MENHTILTHYGPWHNSGWLAKGVNAPSHRAQSSRVGAKGGKGGKREDILGGRKQQLKPFRLHQHRLRRKGGGRFYLQAGVEKGVWKEEGGICGEWGAEAESKASQNNNGGSDSAAASSAADDRLSFVCLQINWVGWSVVRWSTQSHKQSFYFLLPQNLSKQW